jgi:spore coat polysaccharide biosynthesis protein SpsF (cytidylyltransferase family)
MHAMAPRAWYTNVDKRDGRKYKRKVPITLRYEKIMNLFVDEATKDLPQIVKHREELLGTTTEMFTADLFDEIAAIRALEANYEDFMEWDVHTQAKMLAWLYLDNMMETIRKHDRITKQNAEKKK